MNDNNKEDSIFSIECERVILREYVPSDLDAIYAITLQPEIKEYLPDWVASKEQRKIWLHQYEIPENQEFLKSIPCVEANILRLVIVEKNSNKVIGWIVSGLKNELPAPNREIGYGISNEYTRNGYATEAADGLIKYLFVKTDVELLNAVARVDNIPSNKVIQKAGFKYVGDINIDNHEYHHYVLKKSDRFYHEQERIIHSIK